MKSDPYTLIHKAQRKDLYELAIRAGRADWNEASEVRRIADETVSLARHLQQHAEVEERFVHPLMARLPGACETLEIDHRELEPALALLVAEAEALRPGDPARGLDFYRSITSFISSYTAHAAREEALLPSLWECCTEAEIAGALTRFQRSRPPEEGLADLRRMLPALTSSEIAMLLGRLKAGPPQVLRAAHDILQTFLTPDAHQRVCEEAGLTPL